MSVGARDIDNNPTCCPVNTQQYSIHSVIVHHVMSIIYAALIKPLPAAVNWHAHSSQRLTYLVLAYRAESLHFILYTIMAGLLLA